VKVVPENCGFGGDLGVSVDDVYCEVPWRPIQIFIKNLQGANITLDVDMADGTDTVKKMIFDKEGIPVVQQRLFFGTKEMEFNCMLVGYGIKNESNLTLQLNLLGGADDAPMLQQQMAQQQPQQQPTLEQEISTHLRKMNEGFYKLKTRKLGVRRCPYTTPLKPCAGAVDKKRLLLDSKIKKVHKTAVAGRALMSQLHREVVDAQETEYTFQLLKARRLEFMGLEAVAIKERAKRAAEAQERVQAVSTTMKLTISQIRATAAAVDVVDDFGWHSEPEEVDLA